MRERRGLIFLVFLISFSIVSAAIIQEDLHVNIQTTDSNGNVITGTYNFVFNVSRNDACSDIVYSDSAQLTTDQRGIISYYLENVNLDYSEQYWLCHYRDGSLIASSQIARTPYAFRAQYVNLSGVEVDSNFDMSGFNITADYLFGDGRYLTNLNVSALDMSDYFTSSQILSFGYYNASDFNIGDYYTAAQIENFGYYNSSDFNINDYYLKSNPNNYLNETTLNVSSVNYWTKSGSDVYYNEGNVGIGTTSPGYKLSISSRTAPTTGTAFGQAEFYGGNYVDGDHRSGEIYLGSSANVRGSLLWSNPGGYVALENHWDSASGDIRFRTRTSGTPVEAMIIEGDGNVGIGTTAPGAKLQVNDTLTTGQSYFVVSNNDTELLSIRNWAGGWPEIYSPKSIYIKSGSTGTGNVIYKAGTFQLENPTGLFRAYGGTLEFKTSGGSLHDIFFSPNDTEAMRITSDGNVGIGTTNPQNKLNVDGDANVTGQCVSEDTLISVVEMPKKNDLEEIGDIEYLDNLDEKATKNTENDKNRKNSWLFSRQIRGLENSNFKVKEVQIKDVQKGDYVLSLNESSGKIEPAKVREVLYMGKKPIYELVTESGKSINTTKEHPYLGKLYDEEGCVQYEGDVWNKEFDDFNGESCTRWISVLKLREGMEIGIQDYEGEGIKWEKINLINKHSKQHVYDLAIEGTHNFIANGIVAHNTYLQGGADLNLQKIENLANGTSAQDAVTKSQLDLVNSQLSGNVSDNYVPYSGATQTVNLGSNNLVTTGNLIGNIAASNITSGTLAVVRGGTGISSYTLGNYVYASGATTLAQRTPTQVRIDINALNKSGDTMGGILAMGNNKITGLGNGTAAQDAVTLSQLQAVSAGSLGAVTGSGTAMRVPLWNGTTSLNNSNIYQSANGNVGVGASNPSSKLEVDGTFNASAGGGFIQLDSTGNVRIGI